MWFVGNTEAGFVVNKARGLTIGDVQYPRNIFVLWSKEELAAIGIKPYSETRLDSRYYNQGALTRTETDGEMVGTYAAVAKDVDQLKDTMLQSVKSIAGSLQSQVDWYWSRAAKGGTDVPADVTTHATAIYTVMDAKESAIAALSDLAAVIAYQNKPMVETRKIKHTSDEGTETYGPETETHDREVDQVTHGWPTLEDADPSFVSLVDA
jgi:malate synthase